MSVDDRVRDGLASLAAHIEPRVEEGLAIAADRGRRRQRRTFMTGGVAVLIGASLFAVGTAWLASDRSANTRLAVGDPPDNATNCTDVASFGELIANTGVTRDYDPSESPSGLAQRSDIVISGRLLRAHTVETTPAGSPFFWAVLDVEIDDVLVGSSLNSGDTIQIVLEFNPAFRDPAMYDAAPVGALVLAFASASDIAPPGTLVGAPEGIWVGCDASAPAARSIAPTASGWSDIDTIGEVIDALKDPTS